MAKEIHGTLLLLRRGPLDDPWEQTALGQADPPLGSAGREEEAAVACSVARHRPVRVLSSDLRRAAGTAEVIAQVSGASLGVRRDLRERRFGSWQGRLWAELVFEDPAAVAFLSDFCHGTPPRGENLETVARRVTRALHAECRRHPRLTLCYVGHAGPIRALLAHALQLPLDAVQRIQLDPFGLSVIRYQGDASVITLVNHPTAGGDPGGMLA
jgi:broad specificity phosphatase PhoE